MDSDPVDPLRIVSALLDAAARVEKPMFTVRSGDQSRMSCDRRGHQETDEILDEVRPTGAKLLPIFGHVKPRLQSARFEMLNHREDEPIVVDGRVIRVRMIRIRPGDDIGVNVIISLAPETADLPNGEIAGRQGNRRPFSE